MRIEPEFLFSELSTTAWKPKRTNPGSVMETVTGYVFPGSYVVISFPTETESWAMPVLGANVAWHPVLEQCFSSGAPVLAAGAPLLIISGRPFRPAGRFL